MRVAQPPPLGWLPERRATGPPQCSLGVATAAAPVPGSAGLDNQSALLPVPGPEARATSLQTQGAQPAPASTPASPQQCLGAVGWAEVDVHLAGLLADARAAPSWPAARVADVLEVAERRRVALQRLQQAVEELEQCGPGLEQAEGLIYEGMERLRQQGKLLGRQG